MMMQCISVMFALLVSHHTVLSAGVADDTSFVQTKMALGRSVDEDNIAELEQIMAEQSQRIKELKSKTERCEKADKMQGVKPPDAFYIPKKVNGSIVLIREGVDTWRASNDYLKSDALGVAFRGSKHLEDKVNEKLWWDEILHEGVDEGDGWVRFLKTSARTTKDDHIIRFLKRHLVLRSRRDTSYSAAEGAAGPNDEEKRDQVMALKTSLLELRANSTNGNSKLEETQDALDASVMRKINYDQQKELGEQFQKQVKTSKVDVWKDYKFKYGGDKVFTAKQTYDYFCKTFDAKAKEKKLELLSTQTTEGKSNSRQGPEEASPDPDDEPLGYALVGLSKVDLWQNAEDLKGREYSSSEGTRTEEQKVLKQALTNDELIGDHLLQPPKGSTKVGDYKYLLPIVPDVGNEAITDTIPQAKKTNFLQIERFYLQHSDMDGCEDSKDVEEFNMGAIIDCMKKNAEDRLKDWKAKDVKKAADAERDRLNVKFQYNRENVLMCYQLKKQLKVFQMQEQNPGTTPKEKMTALRWFNTEIKKLDEVKTLVLADLDVDENKAVAEQEKVYEEYSQAEMQIKWLPKVKGYMVENVGKHQSEWSCYTTGFGCNYAKGSYTTSAKDAEAGAKMTSAEMLKDPELLQMTVVYEKIVQDYVKSQVKAQITDPIHKLIWSVINEMWVAFKAAQVLATGALVALIGSIPCAGGFLASAMYYVITFLFSVIKRIVTQAILSPIDRIMMKYGKDLSEVWYDAIMKAAKELKKNGTGLLEVSSKMAQKDPQAELVQGFQGFATVLAASNKKAGITGAPGSNDASLQKLKKDSEADGKIVGQEMAAREAARLKPRLEANKKALDHSRHARGSSLLSV